MQPKLITRRHAISTAISLVGGVSLIGCGRNQKDVPVNPNAIDLRTMKEPLEAEISKSLLDFSTQHPNVSICTVGLWGDGFHGTASLHLDTKAHSDAFVMEWEKNGPTWYGEDEQGRFCDNCWDFPHCIGEYTLKGYPDLYEAQIDAPTDFITLDGSRARAEARFGDEGKHQIVFPFLKTITTSFQPFAGLKQARPFRVGVQMRDSHWFEFWVMKPATRQNN